MDAAVPRGRHHVRSPSRRHHGKGVEELLVRHLDPGAPERGRQHDGVPVGASGDGPESVRAVVDGVHAGHDGQQHLGGADVGGRLVTADVLLAGLQSQAIGRPPLGVHADPDQPAGQVPLQPRADGHEAGVRTAVEKRDAEPLARADHHVSAERPGGLEQREREQVGRHHEHRAAVVGLLRDRPGVDHLAVRAGVLQQDAAQPGLLDPVGKTFGEIGQRDLDAHGPGPGLHHLDRLWERVGVDDEGPLGLAVRAAYQRHRLGRCGSLVEEAGVGGGQAGQVPDHRLEVE